jgi:hypothetical protein
VPSGTQAKVTGPHSLTRPCRAQAEATRPRLAHGGGGDEATHGTSGDDRVVHSVDGVHGTACGTSGGMGHGKR